MNKKETAKIAWKIIKKGRYLSLATTNKESPWIAPLYYFLNGDNNFYFASSVHSVHAKHIFSNFRVAFAIFDSHQKEGTGNGVQVYGHAYLVDKNNNNAILNYVHKSTSLPQLISSHGYRFFKIVPKRMYILDPEAHVDKRIRV
jgi:uncharacterized protein YhbP (UPF0306 family)